MTVRTRLPHPPLRLVRPDEELPDSMADRFFVYGIRPVKLVYGTRGLPLGAEVFEPTTGQFVKDATYIQTIQNGEEVRELTEVEFNRVVTTLRRQLDSRRHTGPAA